MNKARRKWLKDTIEMVEQAMLKLENIRDEEQDAYDNLPEGIQDSERGDEMQENVDDMEEASSSLQDIIDQLQEIIDR